MTLVDGVGSHSQGYLALEPDRLWVRQVRSGLCLLLRRHRLSVCTSSLSVRSRRHYLRYRVLCPLIPGACRVAADILSDTVVAFLRNLHPLERLRDLSTTSIPITWRVLMFPLIQTKQFYVTFNPLLHYYTYHGCLILLPYHYLMFHLRNITLHSSNIAVF